MHLDPSGPTATPGSSDTARGGNQKGKADAFEKRWPDLVLIDQSAAVSRQGRLFAVLLEVKRDRSDGPNPADGATLTDLAAQLADMARLHLDARPFMRYSIHLSICGAIFLLNFPSNTFTGFRALHKRGIIHGDISLGNLFLGMTEDIAGFIGGLDLAKVDL